MENGHHQLSYSSFNNEFRKASLLIALLLCAPGACCWLMYLVPGLPGDFNIFLITFFIAVATAIASLIIYCLHPFRPMPWYVIVNLSINVPGLIFGIFAFATAL
jgi:hypothetical protein